MYSHATPEVDSKHFTHKYNCNYLVYFEKFQRIEVALQREKQLKKWSRLKKESLINASNPDWKFLDDLL